MPRNGESKSEAFIRLMSARLTKAHEVLRLIGQLSSTNYEYESEDAGEAIEVLADNVRHVAGQFGVPFSYNLGAGAEQILAARSKTSETSLSVHESRNAQILALSRIIGALDIGDTDTAKDLIRSAIQELQ